MEASLYFSSGSISVGPNSEFALPHSGRPASVSVNTATVTVTKVGSSVNTVSVTKVGSTVNTATLTKVGSTVNTATVTKVGRKLTRP
jgi:hypothetical protein